MQMFSIDHGTHLLEGEKNFSLLEEEGLLQVTGVVDGKSQVLLGIQTEMQEQKVREAN